MRTTLAIDDDVLAAAKGLAAQQHKSVGRVISELARQTLRPTASANPSVRNGILLLPIQKDARPITPELVARLDEELP
jgi:hypothetical protein